MPTQPPDRGRAANVNSTLVLIGYFPKRRTPAPEGLQAAGVDEICSVSECLAPGPEGWVEAWLHNAFGCYDSPDAAEHVAGDAEGEYEVFAYRLLPLRFSDGQAEPIGVAPAGISPLSPNFQSLGFDVVSKSLAQGLGFECSPLSCNLMATEVGVNRHCLVGDLETARMLAIRFSVEEPEPGPYYVVEVLVRDC